VSFFNNMDGVTFPSRYQQPHSVSVALARSTDSTPDSMPDNMPGIEGQGATTAASLFGVLAKETISDDVLCRVY
jgi:hypothetical protein